MSYWGAIVSDIKPALLDWLNVRGGQVSDLALSLINRGRERLWMHTSWDILIGKTTLSLNALISDDLPADVGSIVEVYHDANADGVADWYYYRNDKRYDRRYTISNSLSLTVQPVQTIVFAVAPPVDPVLVYQKTLSDVSLDAHFLIFPGSLVFRAAQVCHIIDKNMNGNEISAIIGDYENLLKDFKEKHQYSNCAMDCLLKDNYGDLVQTEGYTLDGNMGSFLSNRDRSYDSGR